MIDGKKELEHEKLFSNVNVEEAFWFLEEHLSKNKLSWKHGEDSRKFALILVEALKSAVLEQVES